MRIRILVLLLVVGLAVFLGVGIGFQVKKLIGLCKQAEVQGIFIPECRQPKRQHI